MACIVAELCGYRHAPVPEPHSVIWGLDCLAGQLGWIAGAIHIWMLQRRAFSC
ncbi:hypothetical protein DL89DRAFT_265260 [Linderina pennispora]|uniref:Uncharacterized protein n=1 Tax=Linderina pennispora TaxID=61395 RepID=A0A1Y1WI22_9FUNG|nr:uncharacterized protein DL89DRAFT_265260 [Linderina pennispora]ORX73122.1 hypothetical protein DL89DRAFT_265260 [Linderina pennispora]